MSVIPETQPGTEIICIEAFLASPDGEELLLNNSRRFQVGERVRYLGARQHPDSRERPEGWLVRFEVGNDMRCVAKYVYDHGMSRKQSLRIETGRGVLALELEISGGSVRQVRVDMGEPILRGDQIPTILPGNPPLNQVLPDHDLRVTCV